MRQSSSSSQNRLQTATTARRTLDEIDRIEDNNENNADINDRSDEQDTEVLFGREGRDMSVTVIGALLWPTISSIVGRFV
jgi:hypothetical protein